MVSVTLGWLHVDLLEAPLQRRVLLNVLPVACSPATDQRKHRSVVRTAMSYHEPSALARCRCEYSSAYA